MTAPTVGVIGGGIVGLSTAYALARQGIGVTVFDPDPGQGQSAGESRIFRHQHEEDRLIGLAKRSRHLWAEWADQLGRQLLSADGSLFVGDAALVRARAEDFQRWGIEHEILDRAEQEKTFPQLRPATDLALLDQNAGTIHAAETIVALQDRLGDALVGEQVSGCFEEDDRAVLVTSSSVRQFDRVVIAAGDDTPALAARVGIKIDTQTSWHARVSFSAREGEELPSVCLQDRSGVFGEQIYATPEPEEKTFTIGLTGKGVDIAVAPGGLIRDPAQLRPITLRLEEYVRKALPGLRPEPSGYRICRSTALPGGPDEVSVWRSGPFLAIAGGNLFKMAPAVGTALAEAALGTGVPDLWDQNQR